MKAVENPFAIFLMGPTCCGKTQLSLSLSDHLPCEIISVDSALVYKSMDIGTAKPSVMERRKVPHHFIDIIDPSVRYSAGLFIKSVVPLIRSLCRAGKIPLLTGGTMFYFYALEHGLNDMPDVDEAVQHEIEELERRHGLGFLYRELQRVDSCAAENIHPNDAQRIKRGLEIYRSSKKTLSSFREDKRHSASDVRFLKFALSAKDRSILHHRSELRFDAMLKAGLIEEVAALMLRGDLHGRLPSMRTVGYAQIWSYLTGKYGYDEMRLRAVYATRQLIKRQLTWMRSMANMRKYDIDTDALVDIAADIRKNVTELVVLN